MVKNPPASAGDMGLLSRWGKIPWRRKWQPTPVFLPGKPHGWRSLVGYSPWGHKELDMTQQPNNNKSRVYRSIAGVDRVCSCRARNDELRIFFFTLKKGYNKEEYVTENMKVKVAQSCSTLCYPKDCIVHGLLQARILEWVAFPFSSGSSQPRDQTQVSRIAGRFFTS